MVLWLQIPSAEPPSLLRQRDTTRCFAAIMELLWVTIYCVKASFLAQFKFHKLPIAYVSPRLTRYHWIVIGICALAFLLALVVPVFLCHRAGMYNVST